VGELIEAHVNLAVHFGDVCIFSVPMNNCTFCVLHSLHSRRIRKLSAAAHQNALVAYVAHGAHRLHSKTWSSDRFNKVQTSVLS